MHFFFKKFWTSHFFRMILREFVWETAIYIEKVWDQQLFVNDPLTFFWTKYKPKIWDQPLYGIDTVSLFWEQIAIFKIIRDLVCIYGLTCFLLSYFQFLLKYHSVRLCYFCGFSLSVTAFREVLGFSAK